MNLWREPVWCSQRVVDVWLTQRAGSAGVGVFEGGPGSGRHRSVAERRATNGSSAGASRQKRPQSGVDAAREKRVLIAVDETEQSNDAARFVRSLLGADAHFVVMSVVSTPMYAMPFADALGGGYIPPVAAQTAVAEDLVHAEAVAESVASALRVDAVAEDPAVRVASGDAAAEICRVAAAELFDLIVIGSHDRSWFSHLFARSVRDYLVEHAPCPVLVVR